MFVGMLFLTRIVLLFRVVVVIVLVRKALMVKVPGARLMFAWLNRW